MIRTVKARDLKPGDEILIGNKRQPVKVVEPDACQLRKVHVNGSDCYDEMAEVRVK